MRTMKLLSLLVSVMLTIFILAGCGTAEKKAADESQTPVQSSDDKKEATQDANQDKTPAKEVSITLLNSKGEVQTQLEEAAKLFSQENAGIKLEIIPSPAGSSPFEKATSMYASGNAPSLAMLDPGDIVKFKDKFIDLTSEKWVGDTLPGVADAATIDGKLYGFPSTIEGFALIYNKQVLDKAGVDPASIKTRKALEDAFKKVEASGAAPVVISPMDWSLGAHFLSFAYVDQAKDGESLKSFMQSLKEGKVDLKSNKQFTGLMETFDILKKYNIDKKDPLSGTYERGPELLGKGTVGFWFMGNWAWPQIKSFDSAGGQYGFVPVPISDNADDYGNSQIIKGSSKFIGVDKEQNSPDQQEAAKKFLNWIVYEKSGQDFIVNKASFIPAFKNITLEIQDPLGKSIKEYMTNGKAINSIDTYFAMPADHWKQVGASMQKYLAGKSDLSALAKEIEEYWKQVK